MEKSFNLLIYIDIYLELKAFHATFCKRRHGDALNVSKGAIGSILVEP
jgi:hypothetical protein